MSADIFSGQPGDADQLAAIYDLEHDAVSEDVGFYRRLVRRSRGRLLDLGCGSGRLFRAFLDGGASSVRGVESEPSFSGTSDIVQSHSFAMVAVIPSPSRGCAAPARDGKASATVILRVLPKDLARDPRLDPSGVPSG